jgi:hypothetical protein
MNDKRIHNNKWMCQMLVHFFFICIKMIIMGKYYINHTEKDRIIIIIVLLLVRYMLCGEVLLYINISLMWTS